MMRRTLVLAVLAVALSVSPRAARADEESCASVRARIIASFLFDGCESPVGICTQGTIDAGLLAGTTLFTVLTQQAGLSPDTILYTGDFVISTARGALNIRDRGVFDVVRGTFFELDPIVSGTGIFSDARGLLFSFGDSTPTGFDSVIAGEICGLPEDVVDNAAEELHD